MRKGKVAARKRRHAEILLKANEGQKRGSWKDKKISEAFDVGIATVERIRTRFVEEGLEAALNERVQTEKDSDCMGERVCHYSTQ